MMLKRAFLTFVSLVLLLLGGCRFTAEFEEHPDGTKVRLTGEILRDGQPVAPEAVPMGPGTVELENGTTLEGDFYDTDDDGKPDKFRPNEGETVGDEDAGLEGESDGDTWYPLTDVKMS